MKAPVKPPAVDKIQAMVSEGQAQVLYGVALEKIDDDRFRLYTHKDKSSHVEFSAKAVLDRDELLLRSGGTIGFIIVLPADAELTVKARKPNKQELDFLRGQIAEGGLPLATGPHAVTEAGLALASTLPCATVVCVTIIVCVPVSYYTCSNLFGCDTGTFICDLQSAIQGCPSHWCNTSIAVCTPRPEPGDPDDGGDTDGPIA